MDKLKHQQQEIIPVLECELATQWPTLQAEGEVEHTLPSPPPRYLPPDRYSTLLDTLPPEETWDQRYLPSEYPNPPRYLSSPRYPTLPRWIPYSIPSPARDMGPEIPYLPCKETDVSENITFPCGEIDFSCGWPFNKAKLVFVITRRQTESWKPPEKCFVLRHLSISGARHLKDLVLTRPQQDHVSKDCLNSIRYRKIHLFLEPWTIVKEISKTSKWFHEIPCDCAWDINHGSFREKAAEFLELFVTCSSVEFKVLHAKGFFSSPIFLFQVYLFLRSSTINIINTNNLVDSRINSNMDQQKYLRIWII